MIETSVEERFDFSVQLQKLAELLDKPTEERGKESGCSKRDDHQIRPNLLLTDRTDTRPMSSDEEKNQYRRCSDKEKEDFFSEPPVGGGGGGSPVPSEQQQQFCFHQPSWPPDQSCPTSQWWDFWPMNE